LNKAGGKKDKMEKILDTSKVKVLIRGAGDLASGVAWRLHKCGFRVFMTEIHNPLAVRRKVAFCEAVHDGSALVQGVEAVLAGGVEDLSRLWGLGKIPVLVDPECRAGRAGEPQVLLDAILAKRNMGTTIEDAPLVIALGPGFEAGRDCHFVVETNRGHNLGRLIASGPPEPDTGVPGPVEGITSDRVLRAPADGSWQGSAAIGDMVKEGDILGTVEGVPAKALISGVLRGLIRSNTRVRSGLKIGDIDPRGMRELCDTVSEKALAIGGGVLEGILRHYA
jgi:xanthine dehydrogenase accessory factor